VPYFGSRVANSIFSGRNSARLQPKAAGNVGSRSCFAGLAIQKQRYGPGLETPDAPSVNRFREVA
jgi:hypothetical protein